MHNTVPQLGYYHRGLGQFVYNDVPQMGNIVSDLWGSITGSAGKAVQNQWDTLQNQIKNLPQDLKNKAISEFLDSPTGEALTEQAKQSWLEQQQVKVQKVYLQYKSQIDTGVKVAAVGIVGLIVWRAFAAGQSRGSRMATASNPRGKRHKARKHSRRRSKRRHK